MKEISSIYIHFPFCLKKCNYCDFFSGKFCDRESELDQFENLLHQQLKFLEKTIFSQDGVHVGELETIYLGGGTPSLWGTRGAKFLKVFLSSFQIAPNCEVTLEVNPGTFVADEIDQWRMARVNRFSVGVQTLDPFLNSKLDRAHSIEEALNTLDYFHKTNSNFSVDLMLGLPFEQTHNRNYLDELEQILKYCPKHLSVYILTPPENYTHLDHLPDEDYVSKSYLEVSEFLIKAGMQHYEVSNFAFNGHESRHNLQYWLSNNVLSLGESATGFHEGLRYCWGQGLAFESVENLDAEAQKLEKFYMLIRTNLGLDLSTWFTKVEIEKLQPLWKRWESSGYVYRTWPILKLNSRGYLFIDSIMNDIFNVRKIL